MFGATCNFFYSDDFYGLFPPLEMTSIVVVVDVAVGDVGRSLRCRKFLKKDCLLELNLGSLCAEQRLHH